MKKLISIAAALLMAVSFTFASSEPSEARHRGRWVAGLALGLAGAAILSHQYRRHRYYYPYYYPYYYSYYPSYGYYGYDYYPRYYYRPHWRKYGHRHHRRHVRRHSFY